MAVRAGMIGLIQTVRRLIDDTGSTTYSDMQIQDTLDAHSRTVRYAELQAIPTHLTAGTTVVHGGSVVVTGNTSVYCDFWASEPNWEGTAGLTFYRGDFATLTPYSEDPARGRWTFSGSATTPFGPLRPVMITGTYYDVYGAAAELLDMWPLPTDNSDVDVTEGDTSYKFSQRQGRRNDRAAQYRARAWAHTVSLVRSD